MSLAGALEAAAEALPAEADAIRPANGDPDRLLAALDEAGRRRVVAWLLAERPEEGGELATCWIEEPEGAAAVAGVAEDELPKAGRKVLRRLRHRMRSRGVELAEEPSAPRPRVATLPAVEGEIRGAWVSPLDPMGSRLVYLLEPHPSGGARLFEVVTREGGGVQSVEVYAAGRGRVRRFLREVTGRGAFAPVEAEPDDVRALLARAAAEQPADRPLPPSFAEWRAHLAEAPDGAAPPGERARAALGEEGSTERAAALVGEGRLGPWPEAEEKLQAAGERLGEAAEGRVIVSGPRRRERMDELLGEAVGEIFDAPARARTAQRLRESAYVLWKGASEEDARACLAAAAEIEAGDARESPVARALVERPLEPLLRRLAAEAEGGAGEAGSEGGAERTSEEGSLLVKP